MKIRGLTRDLACLLVLAGVTGCAEEKASVKLMSGDSNSRADAGAKGDAGGDASDEDEDDAGDEGDEGDADAPSESEARVTIEQGELSGSVAGDTHRFLGIPYAKPPVEDLRWKRPVEPEPWDEPRDATEYGKRCAQLNSETLMNPPSEDEDCLYLNVWGPAEEPTEPLPVMFWIHGGGNVNGSASEAVPYAGPDSGTFFYDGQKLAEKGVVVVTFNYRLGVFGFLAHPALDEEDAPSGNQGMWDQVAALEWVKTNIDKFGGDPENVTIFGESAGSYDVCTLVASPEAAGLFHKAISQSGGCTTLTTTKEQAEQTTETLAAAVGCEGDDAITCLRDKEVPELLTAADMLRETATRTFGPIVDGDFLPEQPRTLYKSGEINQVPYILGSNTDEGTLFALAGPAIETEEQLDAALMEQFPTIVEEIKEVYPLSAFEGMKPNPAQAALARIAGDSRLVCSTTDAALLATEHVPVWAYNFDIPVSLELGDIFLGATHGAELVYVFQTSPAFGEEETAVSDAIQQYWTNFARSGNPNGENVPEWPEFSLDDRKRLNIGLEEMKVVTDFRTPECALWIEGYEAMFTAATEPAADTEEN